MALTDPTVSRQKSQYSFLVSKDTPKIADFDFLLNTPEIGLGACVYPRQLSVWHVWLTLA